MKLSDSSFSGKRVSVKKNQKQEKLLKQRYPFPFSFFLEAFEQLGGTIRDRESHWDVLKQGSILVDENSLGEQVRILVYLEHSIQDARTDAAGNRRVS